MVALEIDMPGSALVDRVQALEEAAEEVRAAVARIEERVPFVSRFVPSDAYYFKLNTLIETARAVCERSVPSPQNNYSCAPAALIDNLSAAVKDLLAASWGRAS